MECPKCNNTLKDTAKFCGKCGTKIDQPAAAPQPKENACVSCQNPLKPNAKFCGKCGTKQPDADANTQNDGKQDNPNKGYIVWEMQPGQIAMKLTEQIFSQYDKARGVIIPEGYLAMVMVGGKMQSMLEAGVYRFERNKPREDRDGNIISRITGFFSELFSSRKNKKDEQNLKEIEAVSQAAQKRLPVEIVVCRSSDFSLPFTFKNVPTSEIKVDMGILLSIQVSNLMALYKKHLIDKTVLASETLAGELMPYLEEAIHQSTAAFAPEKINLNSEFKGGLTTRFNALFGERFPFFEFLGIIKINTEREELQRLEHLSEEMYLSERELDQLSRRNEFMNRLNQEQNSAELQNASSAADFNRQLAEINRDNLLTEEEMAILQRDIQERSEDHQFDRARATELMVVQHQHDVEGARLKMEEDLGERLFNIQLQRQRKTDEYQDERRRKELEMEKEEQLNQMEMLRQAQAVRQEREQAEHERLMAQKEQDQTHEVDKLNIYAGMSAEQIMVANPNINAEAAKAMAEKFKAEAANIAHDNRAEDAREQTRMMKEFMEQQMQAVRDMSASNAQALSGAMAGKEREIERTQQMADKNEERYAGVVREQIKASSKQKDKLCQSCGNDIGEEQFCPECGSRFHSKD